MTTSTPWSSRCRTRSTARSRSPPRTSGKHVLVDKPMACTTADADEMIAAADANGRGARAVPEHPVRRRRSSPRSDSSPAVASAPSPASAPRSATRARRTWAPRADWFFDAIAGRRRVPDRPRRARHRPPSRRHRRRHRGRVGAAQRVPRRRRGRRPAARPHATAARSARSTRAGRRRPGPDHQLTVIGTEGTLHLDSRTPLTFIDVATARERVDAARHDQLAARGAAGRDRAANVPRRSPRPTAGPRSRSCEAAYSSAAHGVRDDGGRRDVRHVGSGIRFRDHHAAHARSARGLHRGSTGDRGARRPRSARAVPARRARRGVPARVRPARPVTEIREPGARRRRAPRSTSTRGAVLTSCIHTHAGPEHARRRASPRLDHARRLPRHAGRSGASPPRSRRDRRPSRRRRCAPVAGRCPTGLSINRRGLPYEPTFAVVDVIGSRRRANRHRRERLDPSRRARARVPRGVERLGRPVPHRARAARGRHHDPDARARSAT